MRKSFVFICSFLFISSLVAQVKMEDLLSVPFPTELNSTKDGRQFAWVFNNQGVRNVYIADAATFTVRPLTKHNSDDGIEISELRFTPDGNKILFVEGNPNNGNGEAANPAQLQTNTEKTIWIVDVDGKNLRRLAEGNSPVVSPDNKTLLFNKAGQIWFMNLDSTKAPKKWVTARGHINQLRFSPNGKYLTFISNRGDHAFLGLYNIDEKTLSYPDPSVDIDDAPVWSPDGTEIAFIRSPHSKDRLPFTEAREGNPWSIRLLNIATGKATEIWKADKGPGSILFEQLPVAENLLLWAAKDQIIFPWEKDGWQHLYKLDLRNGTVKLLTPGEGEVENMLLNSDKTAVIFNTNIGDSHHRHIMQVDLNDGKIISITKGDGIEWSPVITQSGLVILHSTAITPAWPAMVNLDGSIHPIGLDLFPKNFPSDKLVIPTDISFRSEDGLLIHGQLFLPRGYQPGKKYPALLFFHGGSKRQMLLGYHYMDYYSNDYSMNQFNANNGYIVLSVNYRSGIGYGLNFREALHYGANGGSEYMDVKAAGLYMKRRADVDPKRIGLWGGSYGGYLTAMGLARSSDLFSCGVDIHGVHDWSEEMKNWVSDYDPATQSAFAKTALESSPVHYLSGWKSPVLFIHGDDDRNVPFSQTVNLVEKLRRQNVYLEQLIFPDEVHSFLLHRNWLKAYHASSAFFNKRLKNK
ncbi:MAG: S9 family peptidase [Bacteroidetes bacterium]|nr:S9 family peptidase [Bacteroidota bacterium]